MEELSSDDRADERRVISTSFPEVSSRPPWQSILDDLATKLEELRAAVESIVRSVLPFLQDEDGAENIWFSLEPVDPLPIELSTEPDGTD